MEYNFFSEHLVEQAKLGEKKLEEGDLPAAIDYFSQGIDIMDKLHCSYHFRSSFEYLSYAESLAPKEAEYYLKRAIFMDHNNLEAKQLLEQKSVVDPSQTYLHKVERLLLTPEYGSLENYYQALANRENWPAWLEHTEQQHQLYHYKDACHFIARSVAYLRNQDYDLALNDLVKAENLEAKIQEIYSLRAIIYYDKGEEHMARAAEAKAQEMKEKE